MADVDRPINRGEEISLSFGDGIPFGFDVVKSLVPSDVLPRQFGSPEVIKEIDLFRSAIRTMRKSKDEFDKEVVTGINERFRYDMKGSTIGVKRLGTIRKDVLGWLATASDDEFANFCIWNVAHAMVQQEATDKVTKRLQADTMRKAGALVSINFYPEFVEAAYKKGIQECPQIIALDSFDAGGMGAMAMLDKGKFYMANEFENRNTFRGVGKIMKTHTFHEYSHKADEVLKASLSDGIKNKRSKGFFVWLDEAFVTHREEVANDIKFPQPEIITPSKRRSHFDWYESEREMLALVAQFGPKYIPMELITEAHFSELGGSGKSRPELESRLAHNFHAIFPKLGEHGLYKFSEKYGESTTTNANKLVTSAVNKAARRLGIDELIESIDPDAA